MPLVTLNGIKTKGTNINMTNIKNQSTNIKKNGSNIKKNGSNMKLHYVLRPILNKMTRSYYIMRDRLRLVGV